MLKEIGDNGEEFMFNWLANLGYDAELYQTRSRAFNLSFHSAEKMQVSMKDALLTDLDFHTSQLIIEQYG